MATPALAALRSHWGTTHITVGGPAHCGPLLSGSDLFDASVVLPRRTVAGVAGMLASTKRVAEGRFDRAILLTNSFSSALVVALARIPRRAGYRGGGRGMLLTESLSHPREAGRHRLPTPMVEYYFRLLEKIGVPRGDHHYRLATTDEDEQLADDWLKRQGLADARPLVGIHPGSSFGPSKLWYPERFAEVARGLSSQRGARVAVFCGEGRRATAGPVDQHGHGTAAPGSCLRCAHGGADGLDGPALHQHEPGHQRRAASPCRLQPVPAQALPDRPSLHEGPDRRACPGCERGSPVANLNRVLSLVRAVRVQNDYAPASSARAAC